MPKLIGIQFIGSTEQSHDGHDDEKCDGVEDFQLGQDLHLIWLSCTSRSSSHLTFSPWPNLTLSCSMVTLDVCGYTHFGVHVNESSSNIMIMILIMLMILFNVYISSPPLLSADSLA